METARTSKEGKLKVLLLLYNVLVRALFVKHVLTAPFPRARTKGKGGKVGSEDLAKQGHLSMFDEVISASQAQ